MVGSFVWAADKQWESWSEYRTSLGSADRLSSEIPAAEYRNALIDIVEKSHVIQRDDALREVAKAFGFQRVTDNLRAVLEVVFKAAVKEGRLRLVADEYLPS